MLKLTLYTVGIYLVAAVGLIIGIIALAQIRQYRRKHTEPVQVEGAGSPAGTSLREERPWLNNGFVSGLFMGWAIGVGFWAPYMVVYLWRMISPVSMSTANGVSCFALLVGIGLAYFLGGRAKRATINCGLDSAIHHGQAAGRFMLVILGQVVGFLTGLMCVVLVGAIFLIPVLLR
jgi:hypothetical protein